MVCHESQVILKITAVIARPIKGSAIVAPSATTAALATAERDERVDARVVSISDQAGCQAFPSAQADSRGDLVSDESDDTAAASTQRWLRCCGGRGAGWFRREPRER